MVGLGLGVQLDGSFVPQGLVFSDTFNGTITLSTSVAANQAYQRNGAGVSFNGTYTDGTGDPPSGIAYRVGSSSWKQLTGESIGANAWSGTADFSGGYGQGNLEFKPVNGESVTPASVANITVGEVFAINGQSNAEGNGDNVQSYTPTTYTLPVFADGSWAQRSTDPWSGITNNNGPYMRLAELFDLAGIPLILVRGQTLGSTGFSNNNWNPGDPQYNNAVTDMNLAGTAGWKGWMWDQGEQDVADASTTYDTDFAAMHTAMQSAVDNGAGVKVAVLMLGERNGATTTLDAVRDDIKLLWETNADVVPGPNMISMDYPDDVHAQTDAQLDLKGEYWYRCLRASFFGGADEASGPQVLETLHLNQTQIRVTFDRAVKNHTDTTGWLCVDDTGTLTISSGAAATVNVANDSVVLTFSRDTDGDVALSFGRGFDAVGSTLADTGTDADFPPEFENALATGSTLPAAPVNTVAVSISGTPVVGSPFTAAAGTWTGFPVPTLTYQWYKDDVAIGGATSISYTPVSGDIGGILHIVETATNASGSDTSQSGDSDAVIDMTTETFGLSGYGVIVDNGDTDTYVVPGYGSALNE